MLCCTPSSFEWLHSCGRHPSGPAPAVGAGGVARIQRYQLATPSIYAPSRAPRSVLHLSTGTKKQRPGRVAGGSNLVVKALLASKQLGHYLRAGKKATTCEQASRLLLHSQLGVNQVATHAVLGCNACGTWPRCKPRRRSTRAQHTSTCIKGAGPVRQAQRVGHTHLVPVAAAAFGKLPSCVLGRTEGQVSVRAAPQHTEGKVSTRG